MQYTLEFSLTRDGQSIFGLAPAFVVFNQTGVSVASGNMTANTLKPALYQAQIDVPEGRYLVEFSEPTYGTTFYDQIEVIDVLGRLNSLASDVSSLQTSIGTGTDSLHTKTDNLSGQIYANQTELLSQLGSLSNQVSSIQNNTTLIVVVPVEMSVPNIGNSVYRSYLQLYDTNNNPEAPDSTPTVLVTDVSGAILIPETPMTQDGSKVGVYYFDYNVPSTASLGVLIFEFKVVETGITRYAKRVSELVKTAADVSGLILSRLDEILMDTGTTLPAQISGIDTHLVAQDAAIKNVQSIVVAIPTNTLRENDIRLPWPPIMDNKLATRQDVYDVRLTAFDVWAWADRGLTDEVTLNPTQAAKLNSIPSNPLLTDDVRLPAVGSGRLPTLTEVITYTLQADQVWQSPTRTLTQTISLSDPEHNQLMAIPTDPLRKDDPRLPSSGGFLHLLTDADVPNWRITVPEIWSYITRTLTASALTPDESAKLTAIPVDVLKTTDPRLPPSNKQIATSSDVTSARVGPDQIWGYFNRSLTTAVDIPPDVIDRITRIPTNPLTDNDPRLPAGLLSTQDDVISRAITAAMLWSYPIRTLTAPVLLPQNLWDTLAEMPQDVWNNQVRSLTGNVSLDPQLIGHITSIPTNPLLAEDPRIPSTRIAASSDVASVEDRLRLGNAMQITDGSGKPFSYLSGRVSLDKINFSITVTNVSDAPLSLSPADFTRDDFTLLKLPMEFSGILDSLVVAYNGSNLASTYGLMVYEKSGMLAISWLTENGLFVLDAGQSKVFSATISSPYGTIFQSWSNQRFFDSQMQQFASQIGTAGTVMQLVSAYTLAQEYLKGLSVSVRELSYGRVI